MPLSDMLESLRTDPELAPNYVDLDHLFLVRDTTFISIPTRKR